MFASPKNNRKRRRIKSQDEDVGRDVRESLPNRNRNKTKLSLVAGVAVPVWTLKSKSSCQDKFRMAPRAWRSLARVCMWETRKLYFGLNTYYFVPKSTKFVFCCFIFESATFHLNHEGDAPLAARNEFLTLLSMLAAATQLFTLFGLFTDTNTHTGTGHRSVEKENKNRCEKNSIELKIATLVCERAPATFRTHTHRSNSRRSVVWKLLKINFIRRRESFCLIPHSYVFQ